MRNIKKSIISILTAISIANTVTVNAYAMSSPQYIYVDHGSAKQTEILNASNNIKYDTVIDISDYVAKQYKKTYLVHFNKKLSTGKTENDMTADCETEYGLQGYIDDDNIYVRTYNHTDEKCKTKTIFKNLLTNYELKIDLMENYSILNISNKTPGIYEITTNFKNKNTISIYIYITRSKNIYFCDTINCSATAMRIYRQRRIDLNKLTNKIDPSDNLDYSDLNYPLIEHDSEYQNEIELWTLKSEELCDPSDSDSYKVYKMYKYLINEIAYDYYRADTLHESRASYYNDFSGKYSINTLKTGVCIDFANILAIMCRHQGIPTVTIGTESRNHVWNAVYINNYWYELDASSEAIYGVYKKDTETKKLREDRTAYMFFFNFIPHARADMPDDAEINKYLL